MEEQEAVEVDSVGSDGRQDMETDLLTELVIEAVRSEPCLWNKKSDVYNIRRSEKERAWTRVADNVGSTADRAKERWCKAKQYYLSRLRLLDRSGSGAPDEDKLGPYSRQLSFLAPIVKRGSTVSSASFRRPILPAPPEEESQTLLPAVPGSPNIYIRPSQEETIFNDLPDFDHEQARLVHSPEPLTPQRPQTPPQQALAQTPLSCHSQTQTSQSHARTPSQTQPTTSRKRPRHPSTDDPYGDEILRELNRQNAINDINYAFAVYLAHQLRELDDVTAKQKRAAITRLMLE